MPSPVSNTTVRGLYTYVIRVMLSWMPTGRWCGDTLTVRIAPSAILSVVITVSYSGWERH